MDNDIGSRIDTVIKKLGMKKVHFAEKLKIDQSYVTQLTNGRRTPSERLISDICREFRVNEVWLRTGGGEIFIQVDRSQEISDFVGDILEGEKDSFKRRFVSMLARLDERDWEVLEKMVQEMKKD